MYLLIKGGLLIVGWAVFRKGTFDTPRDLGSRNFYVMAYLSGNNQSCIFFSRPKPNQRWKWLLKIILQFNLPKVVMKWEGPYWRHSCPVFGGFFAAGTWILMVRVYPTFFSWELNIPKLLVVEEVGGTNFHGFTFHWVREDKIFVNLKLGIHKDLS